MEVETQVEYEVEEIIEEKYFKGKPHYLIKWKGYPKSQCTWEPIQNMEHALPYLIEWKKQKVRDDRKGKKNQVEQVPLKSKKGVKERQNSKNKAPKRSPNTRTKSRISGVQFPWKNLSSTDCEVEIISKPITSKMNIDSSNSLSNRITAQNIVIEVEDNEAKIQESNSNDRKVNVRFSEVKKQTQPIPFIHAAGLFKKNTASSSDQISLKPYCIEVIPQKVAQLLIPKTEDPLIEAQSHGEKTSQQLRPEKEAQNSLAEEEGPKLFSGIGTSIRSQGEASINSEFNNNVQELSFGELNRTAPFFTNLQLERPNQQVQDASYLSDTTRPNTVSQSRGGPLQNMTFFEAHSMEKQRNDTQLGVPPQQSKEAKDLTTLKSGDNSVFINADYLEFEREKNQQGVQQQYWNDMLLQKVECLVQDSIVKVQKVSLVNDKTYFQLLLADDNIGLVGHKKMKKMYPHILCDFYEELLKDDPRLHPTNRKEMTKQQSREQSK